MKAKFKVGDKVRVLPRTGKTNDYRSDYVDDMCCLAGKIFTIENVDTSEDSDSLIPDDGHVYKLKEDTMDWNWNSSMLELVEDIMDRNSSMPELVEDDVQYFYLVMVDGNPVKITLQKKKAVKFGRAYLTQHPESTAFLYKQPILKTATIQLVEQLHKYEK